jgi:hypothetical protein
MMRHEANHNRASLRWILSIAVAITFTVLAHGPFRPLAAQKLSHRKPVVDRFTPQGGNDAASVMFRGGRDFISDSQWAKAEEVFNNYVKAYPNDKNIDAALYWMAYSQYKQNKYDQAKITITRLLTNYQDTSWRSDAKTLMAQLPGQTPMAVVDPPVVEPPEPAEAPESPQALKEKEKIKPPVPPKPTVKVPLPPRGLWVAKGRGGDDYEAGPEDDPCEFKIVVLQALIQSDPPRGLAVAQDWLKPGSTQTPRCKSAALTLLARNGGKAMTPVILGFAQNETDVKLKAKAISVLGSTNDDSVVEPLKGFALNAQQPEISEAALYALSQHTSAGAGDKLFQIASSAENIELRKAAISAIGRRGGERAVDYLIKLYDTEKNEELRDQIINSLGYSNDPRIVKKLIAIAKDPQTPIERRKRAIGWLSRSKDPEVLQFLEDLLKQ